MSETKKNREELKDMSREEILKLGNEMNDLVDFSPASDYFYSKIFDYYGKPVRLKLDPSDDNLFFDWTYATLVAWRMNRGKNRLIKFKEFKEEIRKELSHLEKLENCTILDIKEREKEILSKIFGNIHLVKTKKKDGYTLTKSVIVSNSKTLHFILPDLVPPMDNGYTKKLFSFPTKLENQAERFIEIIEYYSEILNDAEITKNDLKNNNQKTLPKFMDNVVIKFIKEKLR